MKKTLWVLLDDRMGSVGQAKGIMPLLEKNFDIIEKNIVYTKFAALPNFLLGSSLLSVNKNKSSALVSPYPDAILSISRRTSVVARHIKKQSNGKTKIIQLLHPGNYGLKDIDLVITPEHDRKGNPPQNIFFVTGSPHRITKNILTEAQEKWCQQFSHLPKPWIGVIVGGAIKKRAFSIENAVELGKQIKNIIDKTGGSLLITTSRRTGSAPEKALMNELKDIPAYTFLWGEKKENPLMGFLACADKIIATGDSVSMCCEACGTGKPVLVFCGKDWLTPKHLRFVQSLYSGKYATALEDVNALTFVPEKTLNPSGIIVEKIIQMFDWE